MKGRPCPPLHPRGSNQPSVEGMWIKTATPRTGMEQGQKNTGKGKKGKKAKPEKVLMPVDKNLAVFGSFQIHSSVVHILPSEYEKKPADLNQQVGGHLGGGRVRRDTQGEKMWELGEMKENRAIIRKLQYRGRRAGQRTVIQSSGGHARPGSTQVKFELD
ncbi:hypothetical protein B0H14DRAFT_2558823 [Mycena olivaceomarginata]|nr:hypothetical protein B0H14DRAFT_2558823 [Mycena olivaceomarginata]